MNLFSGDNTPLYPAAVLVVIKRIFLSVFIFLLVGCTSKTPVSFNYQCPEKRLVQLDLLDLSSSGRSEDILDERIKAIQLDAERVTDCQGVLSVVAWSVSSASSFTIFQGTLATSGATEIGRDRKIAKAVDQTMVEVRSGLNEALKKIDPVGSDLFGAFSLAEDQYKSLGQNDHLEINLFTDAITNVPPDSVNEPGLTTEEAVQLAQRTSQIKLTDTQIKVVGVGKTGIKIAQPPQEYVLRLRTYATAMCENTQAKCRILTTIIES